MAPKKQKKIKTPQEWGDIYKGRYAIYHEFTDKLLNLIIELLNEHKIDAQIESRTKSIENFAEKIQREGKDYRNPLEEITDLVGIRIIAYYKEDIDKIGVIIEKEFDIDWENSIDKAKTLDPDRFGYLSVHYVISLSSPRKKLTEWKAFSKIKAEIQVRTVLQHAWAAIDYKLRYKTAKEVPKNLRRQLFRLGALLELADEEFSNLRKRTEEIEEHYTQEVKKGKLDIELDSSSLEVYLNSTKQHLKWMKIAEQVGFGSVRPLETITKEDIQKEKSRLLRILHLTSIKTIGELDKLIESASKWGKDVLARICKISSDQGFIPFAVPGDVITILVIYARKDILDHEAIEQIHFRSELQEAIIEVITTK